MVSGTESGKKLGLLNFTEAGRKLFGIEISQGEEIPYKELPESMKGITVEKVWANQFGQKELRIHNDIANDTIRSLGKYKAWNNYPADVVEKTFVEQGLIPIGYYYSEFDVDKNELIFLSQVDYETKWITKLRWKINKWFIKRGW